MPDASIVHESPQPGPAAHVLVIGIGRYPHLLNGSGSVLPDPQGLGQLQSPPVSARAIANWFICNLSNPERNMGSVRLLLSEANPQPFVNPRTGVSYAVPPATLANIKAAVDAWKGNGAGNPENLLIFYFCGHGIGNGLVTSLLAEDFGRDPNDALDTAIDLVKFRSGMNSCAARYQCFFIDACRSLADLLVYGMGAAGRSLVTPSALAQKKHQPTFYSTLVGADAHAEAGGKVSYFTQALLEALEGAGSEKSQGDWRISTTMLQDALSTYMSRKNRGQVPPADDLTKFFLHWLAGTPKVPVFVRCVPPDANQTARLIINRVPIPAGNNGLPVEDVPGPWELVLPAGMYDFSLAMLPGAAYAPANCQEYVRPPEQAVPLVVLPRGGQS